MWIARFGRYIAALLLTVAAGGLITAAMVRLSPGFGADERSLDSRLSEASLEHLRREQDGERNTAAFYARHLRGFLRGDLGYSRSLNRPIAALISERAPVTGKLMAVGLGGGWLLGAALALPLALWRRPVWDLFSTAASGLLLCVPSAVLALLLFVHGGWVESAVALIVFPKVFTFLRGLLLQAAEMPHVLAARARGLAPWRIVCRHLVPVIAPQLLALAGVTVAAAFGAAIPVEVFCDLPGIGQLAWKAALGRDLPVLVTLTMLIALVMQSANAAADLAAGAAEPRS